MEEFNHKNMRKVSINIVKANIFSIVLLVGVAVALLVPFFMIWGEIPTRELVGKPTGWLAVFALIIVGIVAHELLHGITWACFATNGWRSISFGVMWKMLTPYCHCSEPMRIPGYMLGAMMPCVVLGVVPALAALLAGSLPLMAWGIFFIAAAAGDIWMTWLLLKEDPKSLVLDHPSEAGFYVIE